MSGSITANRYAEALFQIGNEKNKTNDFQEDLNIVKEILERDNQLRDFLKHSGIKREAKKQFLEEVFASLNSDVVNMFKLLVEGRRTENMLPIIEHFNQLVNDLNEVTVAQAHSVRPLSDSEIKELEASFEKRLNKKKVRFEQVIDPSLIGGLKIIVGNRVYDGSAAGRLRRIEQHIKAANK